MKLPVRLLLPVILLLGSVPLFAADAIVIEQRWSPGKKYFQTIQTAQQSTMNLGPQKMDQSMTMTMDLTISVRAHEDGQQKRMTLKYERLAMELSMNGQKMGFDSANADAGTDPLGLGKTAGVIVGKELKVVLDAHDRIASFEDYEEFIAQFGASSMPGLDPRQIFSREALKDMVTQAGLPAVPGKAVAFGASWPYSTERALPQLGRMVVSGNYTLKGAADRAGVPCVEIATDGTLSMDMAALGDSRTPQGQAMAQLGMKVANGTLKGTVWFDTGLGVARDSQLVQEMTISMKNPADPSATIELPMKQTISATLTKVEDVK